MSQSLAMVGRFRRWTAACAIVALLGALLGPVYAASAGDDRVAGAPDVKAAFVYNFARFIEWPDEALPGAGLPFAICVVGEDGLASTLARAVASKTVGGHPIVVRRVTGVTSVSGCHILFVGDGDPSTRARVPSDRGLLTVGDVDGFTGAGGVIQFVVVDERIRFVINADAAAQAGLKVSSQLLSLAVGTQGDAKTKGP